jgi:hypothetical protein
MSTIKKPTEISGLLGEKVSVRKVNNRLLVTNRPQLKLGQPTAKQLAVREKFLEATEYAKEQTADPATLAVYATGIRGKKRTAFAVALSDYLNAPNVSTINAGDYHGAVGDTIRIHAKDDFKVTRVKVTILNGAGQLLEQGDAIQNPKKKHIWMYSATVANATLTGSKISATAFDMPENETTLDLVL